MKRATGYVFKQGGWGEAIIMAVGLTLLFLPHGLFVTSALIFPIVFWLAATFRFKVMRINGRSIVGFKFLKPFRKTYRYTYKDLAEVTLKFHNKRGWEANLVFRDGIRFSAPILDSPETICKHFIDHDMPISSKTNDLNNFIADYKVRRRISPQQQIALRKARDAARKAQLKKTRDL